MNPENQDRVLLRSLLRGECAAVACYAMLENRVPRHLVSLRQSLMVQEREHDLRARALFSHLQMRGDAPHFGAGGWGRFTLLMVFFAQVSGGLARALALMAEGEEFGLCQYRSVLPDLSAGAQCFIEQEMLVAQERSLTRLCTLIRALHGPSIDENPSRCSSDKGSTLAA